MKNITLKLKPHLLITILLLIITLAYFNPMLEGKKIVGGDTKNWMGMDRDLKEYREKFKEQSAWTDAMFCGMPSYMSSLSTK